MRMRLTSISATACDPQPAHWSWSWTGDWPIELRHQYIPFPANVTVGRLPSHRSLLHPRTIDILLEQKTPRTRTIIRRRFPSVDVQGCMLNYAVLLPVVAPEEPIMATSNTTWHLTRRSQDLDDPSEELDWRPHKIYYCREYTFATLAPTKKNIMSVYLKRKIM